MSRRSLTSWGSRSMPYDLIGQDEDGRSFGRIALKGDGDVWVQVDEADFWWAIGWKWHWRWDRRRKKRYATRSTKRKGRTVTVYLHVEIQRRKGKRRPSAAHVVADHLDGDSLNCRRRNLRWATRSMNAKNKYGKAAKWYAARAQATAL